MSGFLSLDKTKTIAIEQTISLVNQINFWKAIFNEKLVDQDKSGMNLEWHDGIWHLIEKKQGFKEISEFFFDSREDRKIRKINKKVQVIPSVISVQDKISKI